MANTYNPLDAVADLKKAGIAPEHAEAIARNINQAAHASGDAAATKADLSELRASVDAAATKADLAELRASVYRALWLQGAGIIAILTALRFISGQ